MKEQEQPAWLSVTAEAIASWRASPVTLAFLDWIEWEYERTKDAIAAAVLTGKGDEARHAAGRLQALAAIVKSTEAPAQMVPVEDDHFIDPATRPRKRKAPNDLRTA